MNDESGLLKENIERWIYRRKELCGEHLLIRCTQRPIRRTADVIALDEHGRLVIIEIKNERSTRRAVGQILEYLWQYRNATVEDLQDDYADGNPETLASSVTCTRRDSGSR